MGQGVAPHALAPAIGALCGSWLPLGCVQPPPGRTCAAPAVYTGAAGVPVMTSTWYVAPALPRCVGKKSVSSVAEIVTQGEAQNRVPAAGGTGGPGSNWLKLVIVPARAAP